MDRTTSLDVKLDPALFSRLLTLIMLWTEDGILVWRNASHNPQRLVSYPSDAIRTTEDFERLIGRRMGGVTVGYPGDVAPADEELWLRFTDGVGNRYYIEYRDAPPGLGEMLKQLHALALAKCGQGQITALPLHG